MRPTLAAVAFALLAVTAGCAAFGSGDVDQGKLGEEVAYDWNTEADVTITVGKDRYKAVYRFENRSTIELYQFQRLNNERPIDPIGAKFRHIDGTVVNIDPGAVEKTRSRTIISLPASEGQFAYSAPKTGKSIRVPVVAEGSYEVILPPNARVQYPLLGRVSPRGYVPDRAGSQVHLRWEEVTSDQIVLRYYLVRDLLIFGSLVAIAIALVIGGSVYFWLQLRTLRDRREEVALEGDNGQI